MEPRCAASSAPAPVASRRRRCKIRDGPEASRRGLPCRGTGPHALTTPALVKTPGFDQVILGRDMVGRPPRPRAGALHVQRGRGLRLTCDRRKTDDTSTTAPSSRGLDADKTRPKRRLPPGWRGGIAELPNSFRTAQDLDEQLRSAPPPVAEPARRVCAWQPKPPSRPGWRWRVRRRSPPTSGLHVPAATRRATAEEEAG